MIGDVIRIYTQPDRADRWLQRQMSQPPLVACVLGFTDTGLVPGISAAGATPADRRYTALADAEFLWHGSQHPPTYPLPPLTDGVSPALISRALIAKLGWPLHLFNAGLPQAPTVPCVDLAGHPACCLSTGNALPRSTVETLVQQGLLWGSKLATLAAPGFLVLAECVVGGTTTALAVLMGLGVDALGKVNSSHAQCNHAQKAALVNLGLEAAGLGSLSNSARPLCRDPLDLVAAVGDPMQPVIAGMAIAASTTTDVLLAGGTQMLAVYALAGSIVAHHVLSWQPDRIAIGTTRWVAEDPTGDTRGLCSAIGDALSHLTPSLPMPILLGTGLSFARSSYPQLQVYEQGFVKEGVGAGGCAIAASLHRHYQLDDIRTAVEALLKTL